MSWDIRLVYDGANTNEPGDTLVSACGSTDKSMNVYLLTVFRLFPYMVVVSALGVFFIFLVLGLIARHFLLPGILILGSFILFVLWLTGLIETSVQLYGASGNVNDNCQIYVIENVSKGNDINTMAWIMQSTLCEFLLRLIPVHFY